MTSLCIKRNFRNFSNNQKLLLSIPTDGKVSAAGNDSLVTGMVSDVELYNTRAKSHVTEEAVGYATTHALAYAPLHCSPSSAGWKELGNCVIRDILRDMLSEAGFGRGKEAWKLGVGLPPAGWPAGIEEEDPKNNVQPAEAGIGLDIDNEEGLDEHLDGFVVIVVDVVEPNRKKKSTGSVDLKGNLYLPTMF